MKSNFDDDIKSILAEMHEVERESIPGKEQLKERYTLSEIFHKKMSKLCRKVEREEKIRNTARNTSAMRRSTNHTVVAKAIKVFPPLNLYHTGYACPIIQKRPVNAAPKAYE